jgi:hypothetical protein
VGPAGPPGFFVAALAGEGVAPAGDGAVFPFESVALGAAVPDASAFDGALCPGAPAALGARALGPAVPSAPAFGAEAEAASPADFAWGCAELLATTAKGKSKKRQLIQKGNRVRIGRGLSRWLRIALRGAAP